jgi:hypothetical protein
MAPSSKRAKTAPKNQKTGRARAKMSRRAAKRRQAPREGRRRSRQKQKAAAPTQRIQSEMSDQERESWAAVAAGLRAERRQRRATAKWRRLQAKKGLATADGADGRSEESIFAIVVGSTRRALKKRFGRAAAKALAWLPLVLGSVLGMALGAAAFGAMGMADGAPSVWVDWHAQAPRVAAQAKAIANKEDAAKLATRWKGSLSVGSAPDGTKWFPSSLDELQRWNDTSSVADCFKSGACLRMDVSWRAAFVAILKARPIPWVAAANLEGFASPTPAQLGEIRRTDWIAMWPGYMTTGMALGFFVGLFTVLAGKQALAGALGAASSQRTKSLGRGAGALHLASAVAVGGLGAVALLACVFSACWLINGPEAWAVPNAMGTEVGQNAVALRALGWRLADRDDIKKQFGTLGEANYPEIADSAEAAIKACSAEKLCVKTSMPSPAEALALLFAGREPQARVAEEDMPREDRAAWTARVAQARGWKLWDSLALMNCFGFILAFLISACMAICGKEAGEHWQKAFERWAALGRPIQERRELVAAAKQGAAARPGDGQDAGAEARVDGGSARSGPPRARL